MLAINLYDKKPSKANMLGFTLVEMLIAIAITAILATQAIPLFTDFVLNQRVKTASFSLFASLNYARSEAIKRNGTSSITPISGDWKNGWNVTVIDGASTLTLKTQQAFNGLSIPGPTSVTYDRTGHVDAAGNFTIDDSSGNTSVSERCVKVDLTGRSHVQKGSCS